ncbi:Nucleotide-binding universal stress protein, UspA family [Halobacillus karajensis]|uniref:Universal stress protein n=1 Tax=Halobacillus karajensis TaxID=195088 RepID=A0A059NZI8_9BACI|nr:universal stress protein [Halobacillus karajensis]CDQ21154.1 Stress response protein NhaX [Halobacillus karajensis]CDQ24782.1 Stress response protein NhaX [Halobacillus karajensis]CDQ28858.1 Stress response protein NhaX [Halobacillus karajensis]SEH95569.1 Nucleotide-binding universal stress protein, UspA family [Halobacillus karajensis]
MYKKILLAADGSDHSIRTAVRAAELAKLQGDGKVTIIYVIDGDQSKSDVLSEGDQGMIEQRRQQRLKPIEDILQEKNAPYQITIEHGEPGPTIVKYANENAFDLVVIGSRGLNTLQEMVLGSVSHKVAKRAKCPVMIVK